ncbi:MAG: hypothetical protein U1D55_07310 [Phycisphaerae bacterium]
MSSYKTVTKERATAMSSSPDVSVALGTAGCHAMNEKFGLDRARGHQPAGFGIDLNKSTAARISRSAGGNVDDGQVITPAPHDPDALAQIAERSEHLRHLAEPLARCRGGDHAAGTGAAKCGALTYMQAAICESEISDRLESAFMTARDLFNLRRTESAGAAANTDGPLQLRIFTDMRGAHCHMLPIVGGLAREISRRFGMPIGIVCIVTAHARSDGNAEAAAASSYGFLTTVLTLAGDPDVQIPLLNRVIRPGKVVDKIYVIADAANGRTLQHSLLVRKAAMVAQYLNDPRTGGAAKGELRNYDNAPVASPPAELGPAAFARFGYTQLRLRGDTFHQAQLIGAVRLAGMLDGRNVTAEPQTNL